MRQERNLQRAQLLYAVYVRPNHHQSPLLYRLFSALRAMQSFSASDDYGVLLHRIPQYEADPWRHLFSSTPFSLGNKKQQRESKTANSLNWRKVLKENEENGGKEEPASRIPACLFLFYKKKKNGIRQKRRT